MYGVILESPDGGQRFSTCYHDKKRAEELAAETVAEVKKQAEGQAYKVYLMTIRHKPGDTLSIDRTDINRAKLVYEN